MTVADSPATWASPVASPLTVATPGMRVTERPGQRIRPPPAPAPAPAPPAVIAMSPVNELATPLTAPARSEAAYTVNKVTTATPIISAVAAAAVRRGCPEALRPASVPATPRAAASGRWPAGSRGPRRTVPGRPRRRSPPGAPSATIPGPLPPGPLSPAATAARPATSSTTPAAVRRRGMPAGSAADSRSASSGATRDARTAGTRLTAMVTTMPVTRDGREAAAGDVQPARGQRETGPVEHSLEQLGQAESGRLPTRGASHAHGDRLGQHGTEHLAPGGTEGPQQGGFPGPLGDHDPERARDRERGHEQRDPGEDDQDDLERGQELRIQVAQVFRGQLGAAERLHAGWQHPVQPATRTSGLIPRAALTWMADT